MKSLACFLIILMVQHLVKCNHEDDRHVEDHSHEEDREHVNEWVVHIPKGRIKSNTVIGRSLTLKIMVLFISELK